MEQRNHKYMAQQIFTTLQKNGIHLNKKYFIFGNIAPDITLSYLLRRHQHSTSFCFLSKKIRRLCGWTLYPQSKLFSYKLGVVIHYVCDYFCYAHSRAFKGDLRSHVQYEKLQMPSDNLELQPFILNKLCLHSYTCGDSDAILKLVDELVYKWERLLKEKVATPGVDMQVATNAGIWVAGTICQIVKSAASQTIESIEPVISKPADVPLYAYSNCIDGCNTVLQLQVKIKNFENYYTCAVEISV